MLNKIVLAIALIAPLAAQADSVTFGALTHHFDRNLTTKDGKKLNEKNILLAYEHDNIVVGYFKNSYYNDSVMLTYDANTNITDNINIGVLAGAVYGYDRTQIDSLCIGKTCAMVAPRIKYTRWSWQPTVVLTPDFVSFAITKEF